jgi:CarD family transcriptional regulator
MRKTTKKEPHLTSSKNKKAKKATSKKAPAKKVAVKKAAPKKAVKKPIVAAKKPLEKKVIITTKKPAVVDAKATTQKLKVIQGRPAPFGAPAKPEIRTVAPVSQTPENDNIDFNKGEMVVYPAHGVGLIEGVETHTIGGVQVRLYAVTFEKDRMRLKIPVIKAKTSGLRKLCSNKRLKDAIETLQGRSRIRRTMWSRRAQEYETKINSGDPVAIAEVLRDLKRSNDDSEQSYSERQIYQSALERLAREFAAIKGVTEIKATEQLETILGTLKKKEAA